MTDKKQGYSCAPATATAAARSPSFSPEQAPKKLAPSMTPADRKAEAKRRFREGVKTFAAEHQELLLELAR